MREEGKYFFLKICITPDKIDQKKSIFYNRWIKFWGRYKSEIYFTSPPPPPKKMEFFLRKIYLMSFLIYYDIK